MMETSGDVKVLPASTSQQSFQSLSQAEPLSRSSSYSRTSVASEGSDCGSTGRASSGGRLQGWSDSVIDVAPLHRPRGAEAVQKNRTPVPRFRKVRKGGRAMRPDSVVGGFACVVTAIGLFAATFLAVFGEFGPEQTELLLARCHVKDATVMTGPCAVGSSSHKLGHVNCFHTAVKVQAKLQDGGVKTDIVRPPELQDCSNVDDCMEKIQHDSKRFDCWMNTTSLHLQLEGPPLDTVSPAAYTAFLVIVAVPVPFCLLMGCYLVVSGMLGWKPCGSVLSRYSCDFREPGLPVHKGRRAR